MVKSQTLGFYWGVLVGRGPGFANLAERFRQVVTVNFSR